MYDLLVDTRQEKVLYEVFLFSHLQRLPMRGGWCNNKCWFQQFLCWSINRLPWIELQWNKLKKKLIWKHVSTINPPTLFLMWEWVHYRTQLSNFRLILVGFYVGNKRSGSANVLTFCQPKVQFQSANADL